MDTDFKITPAMLRCKANLHKSCPPALVSNLTAMDAALPKYIAPTPMVQLRKWHIDHGADFWEWLCTPIDQDGKALEARDAAYKCLMEILDLPLKTFTGEVDVEVLKAKQKAIDTVLSKGVPMIAIQNNNSGGMPEMLPRGLKGQSPFQLEEKLSKIQKQLPPKTIEGEMESDN